MRKVEILAPAGSYESLCGAINGGCDAVYLGGDLFGARASAKNFDRETLLRAIDYVHLFDKKLYLTVNTLLHNQELEEQLYEYLVPYYEQGLDAVIVQDAGVLRFIHRNFPKLPIHASTQMTFTTEAGGEQLKQYGVTRFVPARELQLQELKEMRQRTDLEIETFVHGALCYCYSGQCFLSSVIGGRSGNRGRCAQPCRMPYQIYDEQGKRVSASPYVLSPKDMCTLDCIPDLVDAGIDSFKIEGRMKKPEYVALTACLYRKYTDIYLEYGEQYTAYLKKHRRELEQDYTCLMDLYNRGGFSKGYFYEKNGRKGMSMLRPNHSGVFVGTVEQKQKNRVRIKLSGPIYAQDVLEFRKDDGTVLYEYTVKDDVSLKNGYTETNTRPGSKIPLGTGVYRTRRNRLLEDIQENILKQNCKKEIGLELTMCVGEPAYLRCYDADTSVVATGEIVQQAKSQPLTEERVKKQLCKLSDTSFSLNHCEVQLSGDVFMPMGQINALRRTALDQFTATKMEVYRREAGEKSVSEPMEKEKASVMPSMVASVKTLEQAYAAEKQACIESIYLDLGAMSPGEMLEFARKSKKKIVLVFPSILRQKDRERFSEVCKAVYCDGVAEGELAELFALKQVSGFLLKNYESVELYLQWIKPYSDKQARLDYNMYTMNREGKACYGEMGITKSTASVEMNAAELQNNGCQEQDLLVYGYPALMTSAQCVCKNVRTCEKKPTVLVLEDRFGDRYYSMNRCNYCYNQLYSCKPVSLHEEMEAVLALQPEQLRLDFLMENGDQVEQIIQYFHEQMNQTEEIKCPVASYTKGHFRKGVK